MYDSNLDFVKIWIEDKQSIIQIMNANMQSDLANGYNPNGLSITRQKAEIASYTKQYEDELSKLQNMTEKRAQHWCKIDLLRRGAIE